MTVVRPSESIVRVARRVGSAYRRQLDHEREIRIRARFTALDLGIRPTTMSVACPGSAAHGPAPDPDDPLEALWQLPVAGRPEAVEV